MLKICSAFIALSVSFTATAMPNPAFSSCQGTAKYGAYARHKKTGTEVRFSSVEICRDQVENEIPTDVVCGCNRSLGGAQVFMALFTGGASLAAARQWFVELQCHWYNGDKMQLLKAVEYGNYEEGAPEQRDAILGQCKAAEKAAYLEFAAGS